MTIRTIRINEYLEVDIDFAMGTIELFITDENINKLHFSEIEKIYDRIEEGDVAMEGDVK